MNEPSLHELRALHRAVRSAAMSIDRGPFLYRVTEGANVETVLRHGTDRHGRAERALDWLRRGYEGPERPWSALIYGSSDAQVHLSLADEDGPSSAFRKIALSPNPHLLVYRATHFERVRDREYSPKRGRSFLGALVLVAPARLPIEPTTLSGAAP